MALRAA